MDIVRVVVQLDSSLLNGHIDTTQPVGECKEHPVTPAAQLRTILKLRYLAKFNGRNALTATRWLRLERAVLCAPSRFHTDRRRYGNAPSSSLSESLWRRPCTSPRGTASQARMCPDANHTPKTMDGKTRKRIKKEDRRREAKKKKTQNTYD